MSKKPGIPYERHQEIGAKLRQIRHDLTLLATEFGNAYSLTGPRSRAYKALVKAGSALDEAKNAAEDNYFADCPDRAFTATYFGPPDGTDEMWDKKRKAKIG